MISGTLSEDVHGVKDKHQSPRRPDDKSKKSRERKPETKLRISRKFCGRAHPFEKGKCPAWGSKWTKCGGKNHFKTKCTAPTKKVHSLRDESSDDSDARDEYSDDSDVEYITSIVALPETIYAITQASYPTVIYTEMVVDKKQVKFQVESGA